MKLMLKELGEIITGNTPSKQIEEFWNSEDICFIKPDVIADSGVNEISESNEYISEEARKKARVVSKNAIFVTCIGSIGKIGIAMDGEYAFNQQINAIIPNEKIDSKYLAYNLLFNKQRLIGMANAPVVPIINKSQFGEFTLNIEIDSDKQSEIVKVLDKLMDIIKHRENELFALDALIKARFVEMFGNPVNNEKGFVKAPMGDYMTLLTDFSSNGSYKTLDSGVTMYDEPNYAWMVRTTDLESGDMTSIKYIDENAYELLAKSKIYGGEIIMNKIGSAGKIYLMPQIDMPASLGRNAFMFRYDDRINVKFLYHLLTSEYGQREIQQYVRGAVTKTITKNDVRAVLIMVPPIELQNEFEAFVKQVDKSKVAVQKTLDETKLLFDSLMQKYFG
ncbi:restriction endonuclease subunit S [Lachnospira eligens]|uniref:restriction endonuclease subunit S n=1 Tax=Lachnospira eligens TaxID=39485 RepID=UPI0032BF8E0A